MTLLSTVMGPMVGCREREIEASVTAQSQETVETPQKGLGHSAELLGSSCSIWANPLLGGLPAQIDWQGPTWAAGPHL